KIWLGTRDWGLFALQGGRVSRASNESADAKINCLLPLENSEMWMGTSKGLLRWTGSEVTRKGVPSSLQHVEVLSMLRDRDANTWVGTTRGLLRYNSNGVSAVVSDTSADAAVSALFEDREGNIWIGSARGLERLRDTAFSTYTVPNLKSQSMGPIYAAPDGDIWFAPIEGGLRRLHNGNAQGLETTALREDAVYSIAGSGRELWLGRQRGGLTHLRYVAGAFTA